MLGAGPVSIPMSPNALRKIVLRFTTEAQGHRGIYRDNKPIKTNGGEAAGVLALLFTISAESRPIHYLCGD